MFYRKIHFILCAFCLTQLSLLPVSTETDDLTSSTPSENSTEASVFEQAGACFPNINDYSEVYLKDCGTDLPSDLQNSCRYIIKILQKVCETFPDGKESRLKTYMDKDFPKSGCANLANLVWMSENIFDSVAPEMMLKKPEFCKFVCEVNKIPICQLFHGSLLLLQDSMRKDPASFKGPPPRITTSPSKTTAAPAKDASSTKTTAAPVKDASSTKTTAAPVKDATSTKTTAASAEDATSTKTTAAPVKDATSTKTTAAPVKDASSTKTTAAPVKDATSTKTTAAPVKSTASANTKAGPAASAKNETAPSAPATKTTTPTTKTPDSSKTTGNKPNTGRDDVPASSHFLAYFLTACVICIAGYVLFHNKQKIVAFIVEGRSRASGRRSREGDYKLLQSNVEEAMSSLDKSVTTKNYIY